jgi:hypothetical protein
MGLLMIGHHDWANSADHLDVDSMDPGSSPGSSFQRRAVTFALGCLFFMHGRMLPANQLAVWDKPNSGKTFLSLFNTYNTVPKAGSDPATLVLIWHRISLIWLGRCDDPLLLAPHRPLFFHLFFYRALNTAYLPALPVHFLLSMLRFLFCKCATRFAVSSPTPRISHTQPMYPSCTSRS